MRARLVLVGAMFACVVACPVRADDFYVLPVAKLHLKEGSLPPAVPPGAGRWDESRLRRFQFFYAIGEHGEEICFKSDRAGPISGAEAEIAIRALRLRSYGNLVILNEWRRRFGVNDPGAFHENVWRTKLVYPGGGTYVWNDELQTMESTVFGHVGAPKAMADVPDPLARVESIRAGLNLRRERPSRTGRYQDAQVTMEGGGKQALTTSGERGIMAAM